MGVFDFLERERVLLVLRLTLRLMLELFFGAFGVEALRERDRVEDRFADFGVLDFLLLLRLVADLLIEDLGVFDFRERDRLVALRLTLALFFGAFGVLDFRDVLLRPALLDLDAFGVRERLFREADRVLDR